MAIYHLTATMISRGRGQSAVAAAAYRAGATLRDEHQGVTHHYAAKCAVHAEIMAPPEAPPWASDRERLWNRVEARERRKDAQLARLIEVGLPVELSVEQRIALLRDYVAAEFVARGMIADFSLRGEERNPQAHILLTLRAVDGPGFGPKQRQWNGKPVLLGWRAAWAACANHHLARAGYAVRIDHRTLEAQQIELLPGRRIGVGRPGRAAGRLPEHLAQRIDEQRRIAHENGAMIAEDPSVALHALAHQRTAFTRAELVRFLEPRTSGGEQLERVLEAVLGSPDLITLPGGDAEPRFTTRDVLDAEASLLRRATAMMARRGHAIGAAREAAAAAGFALDPDMDRPFERLTGAGDLQSLIGPAPWIQRLLSAARALWSTAGFELCEASGDPSAPAVSRNGVLLIANAHRVGLKELERWLAAADHARALAVLLADPAELAAMKAAPPVLALLRRLE